ncbi:MAG: hypothetical protein RIT02_490, partial [Planctomycetota bacterium]
MIPTTEISNKSPRLWFARSGIFLDQRKILCAAPDCIATGVVPFGRAKLLLSRTAVWLLNPTARQEPRPPKGLPARREPRPPKRGITEHQFGDPLQDNTRWL